MKETYKPKEVNKKKLELFLNKINKSKKNEFYSRTSNTK